jgi:DNA polymerase-3 subunit delta'
VSALLPWQHAVFATYAQRRRGGRLPHAWAVTGPTGSGPAELAAAIAASLLCLTPTASGEACGQCAGCALRLSGNHPDLSRVGLLDKKKQIGIDQIRSASASLSSRPQRGGWQVLIVDPADAMNLAAQNALLKTLEEPASDTVLLLVAHDVGRLLPTIRSRCQRLDLTRPDAASSVAWLGTQGVSASEAADAAALLDAGPLALLEAIRDGRLAALKQQLGVLCSLIEGRLTLAEARRQLGDAEPVLHGLADLTALWTRPHDVSRWPAWAELAAREPVRASRLAQAAVEARRQIGSGLSADALLVSWLGLLVRG